MATRGGGFHRSRAPPGRSAFWYGFSGGSAALHHRLISCVPPARRGGEEEGTAGCRHERPARNRSGPDSAPVPFAAIQEADLHRRKMSKLQCNLLSRKRQKVAVVATRLFHGACAPSHCSRGKVQRLPTSPSTCRGRRPHAAPFRRLGSPHGGGYLPRVQRQLPPPPRSAAQRSQAPARARTAGVLAGEFGRRLAARINLGEAGPRTRRRAPGARHSCRFGVVRSGRGRAATFGR